MEFHNLNQRCEYTYCQQIEYLRVKCSNCNKSHCSAHQSKEAHECKGIIFDSKLAVGCPICGQMLSYLSGQKPDLVINAHMESKNCKAKNMVEKKKKETLRCMVDKCLKKLTAVNKYQCRRCREFYCMKHRFEYSHQCNPERFFTRIAKNNKTIEAY